ncbi:hypothetical protein [Aeoliella mucimassa]|nr:hypothetical protein [Aeoliella mucimassa]
MLEELGGDYNAVVAAKAELDAAEKTLANTRAEMEDLDVTEGSREPVLAQQASSLAKKLRELVAIRDKKRAAFESVQSCYERLLERAPQPLRDKVAFTRRELKAEFSELFILKDEIEQHKGWVSIEGSQSLRRWASTGGHALIVWEAVRLYCPAAIDEREKNNPKLDGEVWIAWLNEIEAALPEKIERRDQLQAEFDERALAAREPIHAWMRMKRLEVSMIADDSE